MPEEMIEGTRRTPRWAELEAMAPTLAYDSEVIGNIGKEGTIPVEQAGRVRVPALVLTGGADYPWMIDVGRRLAEAMPNGRHRVLEGQEHAVPPRGARAGAGGFLFGRSRVVRATRPPNPYKPNDVERLTGKSRRTPKRSYTDRHRGARRPHFRVAGERSSLLRPLQLTFQTVSGSSTLAIKLRSKAFESTVP